MQSEITRLRRRRHNLKHQVARREARLADTTAKLRAIEQELQTLDPKLDLTPPERTPNPYFARKELGRLVLNVLRELAISSVVLNNVTGTDPIPNVSFDFINLGRSAVIVSDIYLECYAVIGPLPSIPNYDQGQTRLGSFSMPPNTIYGSDTTMNSKPAQQPCYLPNLLTPGDWQNITAGTETIFLGGYVAYKDIFSQYKWYFGELYSPGIAGFTTAGVPPLYNLDVKDN